MSPQRHERSDEDLVTAAKDGDRAALDELLRRHYERLYTLCRRMCHSREQAEDAVQNTLVSIVKGLAGFDSRARFTTWSYRIAANRSLDEIRRSARTRERPFTQPRQAHADRVDRVDTEDSLDGVFADRHSWSSVGSGHDCVSPEQVTMITELRAQLSRALDSLDERFRAPLVLRDVAEFDYDEISVILGIPPGTVRSRISRARRQMAERVDLTGWIDSRTDQAPSQLPEIESGSVGNREAGGDVKRERR